MQTETRLEKVERLIEQARLRRERERRVDVALMWASIPFCAAVFWFLTQNMTWPLVAAAFFGMFVLSALALASCLAAALAAIVSPP